MQITALIPLVAISPRHTLINKLNAIILVIKYIYFKDLQFEIPNDQTLFCVGGLVEAGVARSMDQPRS